MLPCVVIHFLPFTDLMWKDTDTQIQSSQASVIPLEQPTPYLSNQMILCLVVIPFLDTFEILFTTTTMFSTEHKTCVFFVVLETS